MQLSSKERKGFSISRVPGDVLVMQVRSRFASKLVVVMRTTNCLSYTHTVPDRGMHNETESFETRMLDLL